LFNVIDDFNREGLTIDTDLSLPTERVIRSLNQIIEWRGKPKAIRCDNSPEYISKKLEQWALNNDIELRFIQPGNPQQNAYIERFNRMVRYDWLSHYISLILVSYKTERLIGYRLIIMNVLIWV